MVNKCLFDCEQECWSSRVWFILNSSQSWCAILHPIKISTHTTWLNYTELINDVSPPSLGVLRAVIFHISPLSFFGSRGALRKGWGNIILSLFFFFLGSLRFYSCSADFFQKKVGGGWVKVCFNWFFLLRLHAPSHPSQYNATIKWSRDWSDQAIWEIAAPMWTFTAAVWVGTKTTRNAECIFLKKNEGSVIETCFFCP